MGYRSHTRATRGGGREAAGGSTPRWPRRCRPPTPGNAQRCRSPRIPGPGPRRDKGPPRGRSVGAEPRAPRAPQGAAGATPIPSAPLVCIFLPLRRGPANQRAPLTCWRRGGGGAASPRRSSPEPGRTAPRRQRYRYRHQHQRHGVRGLRLLQELPLRPQPALHGAARGFGFGGEGDGEPCGVCGGAGPGTPRWVPLPPRRERGHGWREGGGVR